VGGAGFRELYKPPQNEPRSARVARSESPDQSAQAPACWAAGRPRAPRLSAGATTGIAGPEQLQARRAQDRAAQAGQSGPSERATIRRQFMSPTARTARPRTPVSMPVARAGGPGGALRKLVRWVQWRQCNTVTRSSAPPTLIARGPRTACVHRAISLRAIAAASTAAPRTPIARKAPCASQLCASYQGPCTQTGLKPDGACTGGLNGCFSGFACQSAADECFTDEDCPPSSPACQFTGDHRACAAACPGPPKP
jgi:hypothetical protein